MSPPQLPAPPVPGPPPPAGRPRHPRRTIVAVSIAVVCVTAGGAGAAVLLEGGDDVAVAGRPAPAASPWSPNAPFEVVKVYPNAFLGKDEWAQMRATDGSFTFFGPPSTYIVPLDPGENADAGWRVTFPDARPDCFIFVYDFDGRVGEPHAYAKHMLRSWVQKQGQRVGGFKSTHQGAVDGWSAYYRWGHSGWGEDRVVVGDDRLYEFGCRAHDQRSLEDGQRFTDSFEPSI